MKHDKKRTPERRRNILLGAALVLGMLVSAAGLAKPVLGQNSWITYTYYNAQGQVVGESSQTTCPGMQPFAWGITTNRFTYVTGSCAVAP